MGAVPRRPMATLHSSLSRTGPRAPQDKFTCPPAASLFIPKSNCNRPRPEPQAKRTVDLRPDPRPRDPLRRRLPAPASMLPAAGGPRVGRMTAHRQSAAPSPDARALRGFSHPAPVAARHRRGKKSWPGLFFSCNRGRMHYKATKKFPAPREGPGRKGVVNCTHWADTCWSNSTVVTQSC